MKQVVTATSETLQLAKTSLLSVLGGTLATVSWPIFD